MVPPGHVPPNRRGVDWLANLIATERQDGSAGLPESEADWIELKIAELKYLSDLTPKILDQVFIPNFENRDIEDLLPVIHQ